MDVATEERLDEVFGALANATRRAILVRLADGEASVNELAEPFAISLPAISRHLKVLEDARLIERSRRAQYRPCQLAPEPLAEVAAWTEQYRPIWEDRLDRLDAALATPDDPTRTSPTRTNPTRTNPTPGDPTPGPTTDDRGDAGTPKDPT